MKFFSSTRFASASTAGYTIIEALIALAIFSIGMIAVSALQMMSLKSTGDVAAKTQAWAILNDQVERLKSMPFYANDNGLDDDGDGTIDNLTEEIPDLSAGNHSANRLNNMYTVHWQVVNDQPIGQQNETVLPGVPAGNYTVSKTISVEVTRPGQNPQTNALAMVEFVKTWAADGIP